MQRDNEVKTIQVHEDTKLKLDDLGSKGDTYDQIIRRLIAFYEKKQSASETTIGQPLATT